MRHDFIGRRVLNIHRQGCDFPETIRKSYYGTIIDYLPGCNPLFKIKYDGREFSIWHPLQDLSDIDTYPHSRGIFETI